MRLQQVVQMQKRLRLSAGFRWAPMSSAPGKVPLDERVERGPARRQSDLARVGAGGEQAFDRLRAALARPFRLKGCTHGVGERRLALTVPLLQRRAARDE